MIAFFRFFQMKLQLSLSIPYNYLVPYLNFNCEIKLYIYIYIYTINNKISYLVFNILRTLTKYANNLMTPARGEPTDLN